MLILLLIHGHDGLYYGIVNKLIILVYIFIFKNMAGQQRLHLYMYNLDVY